MKDAKEESMRRRVAEIRGVRWDVCGTVLVLFATVLLAAVPRQIAYQGVLTDANGNPRPDGKYHFSFQLFPIATGGSALTGFSQAESLTVKNGVFSTVLGKSGGINLPFNDPYWLGVTVNGTALTQRVALTSAAYAMRSAVADSAVAVRGGRCEGESAIQYRIVLPCSYRQFRRKCWDRYGKSTI